MSVRDAPGASALDACLWCDQPIEPRLSGGSPRKFCSPRHRTAFHSAARRWAERKIAAGILTIAELRQTVAERRPQAEATNSVSENIGLAQAATAAWR